MDYEKKYKEALENARQEYDTTENVERKQWLEELFPELAESEDERIRKWIINEIKIKHHNLDEDDADFVDKAIAWLEKQGEKKPFGYNNLAELAKAKATTSDGISEDMMSLRIEHTPLSVRTKNALRCQFKTIGDMVSYCEGKWRRLRGLRYIGKATYNEIMEYLGIDDRL